MAPASQLPTHNSQLLQQPLRAPPSPCQSKLHWRTVSCWPVLMVFDHAVHQQLLWSASTGIILATAHSHVMVMGVCVFVYRSASAPDLQNPAAVQKKPPKKQASQSQHARPLGTPPLPRHQTKHLHSASVPPGTPGEESAANTPSSSRASTPPRRSAFDCYIGMAAA